MTKDHLENEYDQINHNKRVAKKLGASQYGSGLPNSTTELTNVALNASANKQQATYDLIGRPYNNSYGTIGLITQVIWLDKFNSTYNLIKVDGDVEFGFENLPYGNSIEFDIDITHTVGGEIITMPLVANLPPLPNTINDRYVLHILGVNDDAGLRFVCSGVDLQALAGSVPVGNANNDHLQWNGAAWIAQQPLNFNNNTIGLKFRNVANTFDIEVKTTTSNALDITNGANAAQNLQIRSQHATEADQLLIFSIGSGSQTSASALIDASTTKLRFGAAGADRLVLDVVTNTELTLGLTGAVTSSGIFNVRSSHVTEGDNLITMTISPGDSGIGQLESSTADLWLVAGGAARIKIDSSVGTEVTQTAFSINPVYSLFRDDTTINDDIIGTHNFYADNSTPAKFLFASVFVEANNVVAMSEEATLYWSIVSAGTLLPRMWLTGANLLFADDHRTIFNPDATNAGMNVGLVATDPTAAANADIWYNSTSNKLRTRENGVDYDIITSADYIGHNLFDVVNGVLNTSINSYEQSTEVYFGTYYDNTLAYDIANISSGQRVKMYDNIDVTGTSIVMYSGSITRCGIIQGFNSTYDGYFIRYIGYSAKKIGSPTGNVTIAHRNNADTIVNSVTKDVSTFTTSFADYEADLGVDSLLATPAGNARITIEYSGGDVSNHFEVEAKTETTSSPWEAVTYNSGYTQFTTQNIAMTFDNQPTDGAMSWSHTLVSGDFYQGTLISGIEIKDNKFGLGFQVYNPDTVTRTFRYNIWIDKGSGWVLQTGDNPQSRSVNTLQYYSVLWNEAYSTNDNFLIEVGDKIGIQIWHLQPLTTTELQLKKLAVWVYPRNIEVKDASIMPFLDGNDNNYLSPKIATPLTPTTPQSSNPDDAWYGSEYDLSGVRWGIVANTAQLIGVHGMIISYTGGTDQTGSISTDKMMVPKVTSLGVYRYMT